MLGRMLFWGLLVGQSVCLVGGNSLLQSILKRLGKGADHPRSISIYTYDIPEHLLHAGGTKNITTCPYPFYSTEIVIPEITRQRLSQPPGDPFEHPEAIRADYYLVPQYSACHYHQCLEAGGGQGCRLAAHNYMKAILDYVESAFPFWDRHNGLDHIFVFAWDRAAGLFGSFLANRLASSIHLTHLGTPAESLHFSPTKDICIPALRDYSDLWRKHHPSRFEDGPLQRPLFAYFRGVTKGPYEHGKGIRQKLALLAKTDPHHYYVAMEHSLFYWQEIVKARFALCPPGWAPWSPRLFDAIVAGAIPVIISDDWDPPFSSLLNYTDFSIRIPESKVDRLTDILLSITDAEERRLRRNLGKVYHHFVYSLVPYKETDAFEMIYEILRRKKASQSKKSHGSLEVAEDDPQYYEEVNLLNFYALEDEERINLSNELLTLTKVEL